MHGGYEMKSLGSITVCVQQGNIINISLPFACAIMGKSAPSHMHIKDFNFESHFTDVIFSMFLFFPSHNHSNSTRTTQQFLSISFSCQYYCKHIFHVFQRSVISRAMESPKIKTILIDT